MLLVEEVSCHRITAADLWFTGTLHMPSREPTGYDENGGACSQTLHLFTAFLSVTLDSKHFAVSFLPIMMPLFYLWQRCYFLQHKVHKGGMNVKVRHDFFCQGKLCQRKKEKKKERKNTERNIERVGRRRLKSKWRWLWEALGCEKDYICHCAFCVLQ